MNDQSESHFRSEQKKDVTIIHLRDGQYIDRLIGGELEQQLVSFCETHHPSKLLIDFQGVQRFSSETINALLMTRERVKSDGGTLALCELAPNIREAFQISKLEGRIFPIYDSLDDGLNSI